MKSNVIQQPKYQTNFLKFVLQMLKGIPEDILRWYLLKKSHQFQLYKQIDTPHTSEPIEEVLFHFQVPEILRNEDIYDNLILLNINRSQLSRNGSLRNLPITWRVITAMLFGKA